MNAVGYIGIGVAVVVLALIVGFYAWSYRRNQKLGTPGVVSRSRLTCPKCHQSFDYDYVPGASLTAVRLGHSRYMACPLCGQWSTFDLSEARLPRT